MIIELEQPDHNPNAIGAVIVATCNDKRQIRQITAGHSFLAQSPPEAHFGFGTCTGSVTLSIRWPDGDSTTHSDLPVNHRITIHRHGQTTTKPFQASTELSTPPPTPEQLLLMELDEQKSYLVTPGDARNILVNIWAPWCKACKREIPQLKAWSRIQTQSYRVVYVSFEINDLKQVTRAADYFGIHTLVGTPAFFDYYLPDTKVEIPVTLLLNHRGEVLKKYFGGQAGWSALE